MVKDEMTEMEFWKAYLEAVKSGMGREQFCKEVGMTDKALYQRIRHRQKAGWDLPQLPTSKRSATDSQFNALMKEYGIKRKETGDE